PWSEPKRDTKETTTRYGYARVNSTDQDVAIQVDALTAAGCDAVGSEKVSGTSTAGRQELATMLEFIRKGDVLVVTRIDRLARSIADLQDIIKTLKAKGADHRATYRHQHGSGEGVRGHARGVRGVRDEPPARVATGGHRQGESRG